MNKFFASLMMASALMVSGVSANEQEKAERPKINTTKQERFGNWSYECHSISFKGKDGPEKCLVSQRATVTNEKTKQSFVVFWLQIVKDPKTNDKYVSFRTEHSMSLADGITVKFDNSPFKTVPYKTCLLEPLGCAATIELSELDQKMKNSNVMEVSYKHISGKPIVIEFELKDYAKAVAKL